MIASQQSYSGSIAESLAFDDDENTAQTPTFKVNVLSFKHIPRAFSRSFSDFGDMNIDDSVHHQSPEHPNKAYKCYKCFGRKTGDDIFIKISKCRQCEGSQYIGQNHPIVSIMEQIIKKKIPSLPKRQQQQKKQQKKVETLQLQYGCRDAIKEQSFSYQEQAVHCNSCKKQCDFNCYHTCQKCGDYNICQNCFKKKRFSHIHPLVLKDISKMPSRMSFMPSNLKINLDPQSSLQQSNKNECCNCREPIDICYEVCVDCEKKGINYIICNKCCQDKQYKHNPYHELQLRTLSQLSQINCIQSNSSIAHQNLELNSISNNISQHKSKNKVNNDWLNSSLEQSQNLSNPFENYMPEEVHFDLSDNLLEDDLFVFKSKQSKTEENIPSFECQQESRIQHNSSQMKVNLSSSFYLQKDREKPTAYDISFEPNQRNPQAAYLFNGYQCDICGVQPIKNRRFHCKQCQDYDLCQMCFFTQSKSHRHIHFQEIDGQQLLRQRESILKSAKSKIQQLGNSARLKHSLHLKQI